MEKLQAILQSSRVPVVRSSAALGALLIVLAWHSRKQKQSTKASKLITDLSEVAQKVEDGGYAHDEYDVIIIGGGAC